MPTIQAPTTRTPRKVVRAESVGSLLRPKDLRDMFPEVYGNQHTPSRTLLDEEGRKKLKQLEAKADDAVEDVLRKQIDIGLDIVTDGEMRRAMFTHSLVDALEGYEDNDHILDFTNDKGEVMVPPTDPKVGADRLRKVANPAAEEIEYVRSLTDYPVKVTFPAVSYWYWEKVQPKPGVYENQDEFVAHVVELQRELIAEVIEAGASYVQMDWPIYAILVDRNLAEEHAKAMGETPESCLQKGLAADNAVLEGIPDHVTTALHICRGNYRSRWMTEGSLEPVAEPIFNELNYDRFLVEWEDTEREGDYTSLRFVPKNGPTVVMGVVSTKDPEVESADDIEGRIVKASEHLDVSQLALSPQCGFASTWEGNDLAEERQWEKLEVVAEVADRVWGRD